MAMQDDVKIPQKYAFNNDADGLVDVFGLPRGYNKTVEKSIRHAAIDNAKTGEIMECVLNDLKPKNAVEAAYIGYAVGGFLMDQIIEARNRSVALDVMRMIGGKSEE